MANMHICIPSRGRFDRMLTLDYLPPIEMAVYVYYEEENNYHLNLPGNIHIIPVPQPGIRYKRQFIFDHAPSPKILMLDDDLKIYKRTEDGRLWRTVNMIQASEMLQEIDRTLDIYAAVGVADKYMGQGRPRHIQENQRFNQILGFNLDLMPSPLPTWRAEFGSDYDMILQLLSRGCKTAVLTEWAKNDVPWGAGGCTATRTPEINLAAHRHIEELWNNPGIYRIVKMPTATNPHLGLRIGWKAAAKMGGLV